jgi:Ca2+-binding RTX toxin-like protein
MPLPPEPEKVSIALEGTAGKDALYGTRGSDTIGGGAGDDVIGGKSLLHVEDGNDQLSGGAGSDILYGGPGDDLLDGGEGMDTVTFDPDVVGLTMPTKVGARVDLSLTSVQNTRYGHDTFVSIEDLVGTSKADRFKGNAEKNSFWGHAGHDRLWGRDGDDYLDGGAGKDRLAGDAGNDTLAGGTGNDVLTGGAGDDVFTFTVKTKARGGVDRITDFEQGEDKIALVDPRLKPFKDGGALAAGSFTTGTAAADRDDRVIYDAETGVLSFDPDGSGSAAAFKIARLAKGLALSHDDFIL